MKNNKCFYPYEGIECITEVSFTKTVKGFFSKYICIPKKRPLQLSIVISREKMLNHLVMVAKLLDDNKLKTSLKSEFALFQPSSILFSLKLKGLYLSLEKKEKHTQVRKIGKFHITVVQRWLKNVQKSVMNKQSYCFSMPNAFLPISLLSRPSFFKLLIVVIQKFCYHGNETSHFSLYHCHFHFLYSSSFLIMFTSINLY